MGGGGATCGAAGAGGFIGASGMGPAGALGGAGGAGRPEGVGAGGAWSWLSLIWVIGWKAETAAARAMEKRVKCMLVIGMTSAVYCTWY